MVVTNAFVDQDGLVSTVNARWMSVLAIHAEMAAHALMVSLATPVSAHQATQGRTVYWILMNVLQTHASMAVHAMTLPMDSYVSVQWSIWGCIARYERAAVLLTLVLMQLGAWTWKKAESSATVSLATQVTLVKQS